MMAISNISMCLCLAFVILAASRFDYISATESSSAEESESREFVVTLDHSNFTDLVAKHKFIVVDFYAPWCMWSEKLAPEYEKAASLLSKTDPQVVLAKVDAIDPNNKPLANEYKIRGFPTLKILRYGGSAVQGYYGPRDADGIVSYLKKQSGPASVELKLPDEVTSIIESNKILVVGVFPELSGESFENFTTLADRLRDDCEFGHTMDAKLLPHGDISSGGPFVRLFKPFDELVVNFQEFDVDALVKFVEETSIPTLRPKHHPFVIKYLNSPNAKATLFLNFTNGQFDAFQSKYNNVALQYKGQGLIFRISNVEGSKGAFQYYGIKEDQVPLIIIRKTDGEKYLKPNVEPDQIESWIKDFKDGIVQPYKKSEPVPDTNDEPVKVVVGDSMQEMVLSSAKNALIEFYAPWCGHCKKLAPILGEVAVSFENDPDVIIAKIDATANDIPHETFDVKGYPTLYFKSSSGNVVQYNGDRTKEDMIDFIQKHRDTVAKQGSRKRSGKKGGSSTLSLQNIYSPVILKFFQVFGELFNYKVKQNPSIASKYHPAP